MVPDLLDVVEGIKEGQKRTEKDEVLADYLCDRLSEKYTIQAKEKFSAEDREGTRAKFLLPPEKGSKTMIVEIARIRSGTEKAGERLLASGGLATIGAGLLMKEGAKATVKRYRGDIKITLLEPKRGFLDKMLGRKKQENTFSITLDDYVDDDLNVKKDKVDADMQKWFGWV